eukprot:TRINITY_DN3978_c0_g1_i1.p1 TRINITY_DN3978_c0_g1~~TRINITY_DN3978_c0_g1_i1.p1  ORF type:complete len:469 (+),score=58.36 TRINITY_DN3978_c0_g1_i1:132-1538(+)
MNMDARLFFSFAALCVLVSTEYGTATAGSMTSLPETFATESKLGVDDGTEAPSIRVKEGNDASPILDNIRLHINEDIEDIELLEREKAEEAMKTEAMSSVFQSVERDAMTFYVQGIMKTGTMTFATVFVLRAGGKRVSMPNLSWPSFMSIPFWPMNPSILKKSSDQIDKFVEYANNGYGGIVYWHYKYGQHLLVTDRSVSHPFVYAVTLRDPIDRWKSWYRMRTRGGTFGSHVKARNFCNLQLAFLTSNLNEFNNQDAWLDASTYLDFHCPPYDQVHGAGDLKGRRRQVPHHIGLPANADMGDDQVGSEVSTGYDALRLAKRRIDKSYAVVMVLARSAESLCLMNEVMFDGRGVCAIHSTTPHGHSTNGHIETIATPQQMRVLEEKSELDYILIDFANRRLDVMLDMFPQCRGDPLWADTLRDEDKCSEWLERHVEGRNFCLPFGRCGMTADEIGRIRAVELDFSAPG